MLDFCEAERYTKWHKGVVAFLHNIGFGELLVIGVIALVIFGPQKLPELGKSLGSAFKEFRKATQSISEEVTKAATEDLTDRDKNAGTS